MLEPASAHPRTPLSERPTPVGGARFAEFTSGLLLAGIIGVLGSVAALLRLEQPTLLAWLALSGAAATTLGPLVGVARAFRPAPSQFWSFGAAVVLALGPWVVFAERLWSATHHRPLGAVTFGVVAALILAGCFAVAMRLRNLAVAATSLGWRRVARGALILALGLSLTLVLAKVPAALASPSVRTGLTDASLLLGLSALCVNVPLSERVKHGTRLIGLLAFVGLAAATFALLRSPALHATLARVAAVPLGPWAWIFGP